MLRGRTPHTSLAGTWRGLLQRSLDSGSQLAGSVPAEGIGPDPADALPARRSARDGKRSESKRSSRSKAVGVQARKPKRRRMLNSALRTAAQGREEPETSTTRRLARSRSFLIRYYNSTTTYEESQVPTDSRFLKGKGEGFCCSAELFLYWSFLKPETFRATEHHGQDQREGTWACRDGCRGIRCEAVQQTSENPSRRLRRRIYHHIPFFLHGLGFREFRV